MAEKDQDNAVREAAAAKRADYVRALEEELDMCERGGKADRVKAINAELKRAKGAPVGRKAAEPTGA